MDDKAFDELRIRATVAPQAEQWPDDLLHFQRMKAVITEARERVSKAYAHMDEIDRNADLSREGKERQRRKAAAQAIADFEVSKTLARARGTVAQVVEQWVEKVGLTVKVASNIHEATVHTQIRDRLAAMKDGRMGFLEKNAGDPIVASAILTAPAFLSGLSDAELAMVKHKVEQHVSPEIAEARAATLKALEHAEAGWQKAMDEIGERAGLTKGSREAKK